MTIKKHGGIFGRNPTFNEIGGTLTTAAQPNITSLGTQTSNLAFASGNGIDFSATAGTGTSELFSDYEQGSWTPVYSPATGAFGSVTYDTQVGKYTKVGNIVNVRASLRTDAITVGTASGSVTITGLPYSGEGNNSSGIYSAAFGGDAPDIARVSGPAIALYFRSSSSGNASLLQVSDLNTGTNDNYVFISLTYEVA